ncbi:MAG: GNAT family N-acetyltransferase [Chloroflexota bacterium]|nr:GNAT family N-acetyltransferase [Chloroflexota bacterium]MBI5703517.1 GNAT family N-acetyltransferase [Chloroflexota bacterium]
MDTFDIRPASVHDIPSLMAMDHTCSSEYVWQLELRSEPKRVMANFHEVRLPRAVTVMYPRDPASLLEEWERLDVFLVAAQEGRAVGYIAAMEEPASSLVRVTDLVVAAAARRQGVASALLTAVQAWALDRGVRRILLEMQAKNHACIRLAQKFGYEFCGYNDRYYPTQDVALFFGRALK